MGADAALDPNQVEASNVVLGDTGQRGADLVFDCATKGSSTRQAILAARRGGRVCFTGIPSEMETPLEFHVWRRKELKLWNVRRSNHDGEQARELLAMYPGRFAVMITHTRPFDQIAAAFTQIERYEDGVGKLIVRVDR
jgi:L-iditol 2-dehydrogenase